MKTLIYVCLSGLSWSAVGEFQRWTGEMALPIAMSGVCFWVPREVAATSSPRQEKPKKQVTQTAHSMIHSHWFTYGT